MELKFVSSKDVSSYLKKLNNHTQRFLHSLYKRKEFQDCSLMNMWVCDFLYDNRDKEIYQKDIEQEFFINRATASKMLLLMEEKELIRRKASECDGRLKKTELLPKGRELHEVCTGIRREIEKKLTKTLSEEETEQFKHLCEKMLAGMEQ